jgi:hypothetical protein
MVLPRIVCLRQRQLMSLLVTNLTPVEFSARPSAFHFACRLVLESRREQATPIPCCEVAVVSGRRSLLPLSIFLTSKLFMDV